MVRFFGFIVAFSFASQASAEEAVKNSEFFENTSGYPCSVKLITDEEKSISLQLSDYKNVWSLQFNVPNRASSYKRFFDDLGLRDERAFKSAFEEIRIGKRRLKLNDVSLLEVQRKDVDARTFGMFSLDEIHNVVRALDAMVDDGVEIKGLFSLESTTDALSDFRACSYTAMGLQEGEKVETDFRAEYRMIFHGAFENWVTTMARSEHCLVARLDDQAISEVIEAAAEAFYPGFLNFQKRREYRDELDGMLPMAKLSGMIEARAQGCFMAGRLAEISRMPVDRAIEEAAALD
mgnify:FL=1